jgi:DNA-binding SARP family transcriptional activator
MKLAALGQFGRAVEAALAAVASEPLRESAHRALISVHLAQGNQVEAIRQYCSYANLLREELELEPSEQMHEMIGALEPECLARWCNTAHANPTSASPSVSGRGLERSHVNGGYGSALSRLMP